MLAAEFGDGLDLLESGHDDGQLLIGRPGSSLHEWLLLSDGESLTSYLYLVKVSCLSGGQYTDTPPGEGS